jgi:hypothetical protein
VVRHPAAGFTFLCALALPISPALTIGDISARFVALRCSLSIQMPRPGVVAMKLLAWPGVLQLFLRPFFHQICPCTHSGSFITAHAAVDTLFIIILIHLYYERRSLTEATLLPVLYTRRLLMHFYCCLRPKVAAAAAAGKRERTIHTHGLFFYYRSLSSAS